MGRGCRPRRHSIAMTTTTIIIIRTINIWQTVPQQEQEEDHNNNNSIDPPPYLCHPASLPSTTIQPTLSYPRKHQPSQYPPHDPHASPLPLPVLSVVTHEHPTRRSASASAARAAGRAGGPSPRTANPGGDPSRHQLRTRRWRRRRRPMLVA